jgi:molecular chaperone HscB
MDFSQTYFELFDLPATYALDRERLDAAYRSLQAEVHPDKFASRPEADQRVAMQWATRANEAYQTLKQPVSRGVYLLQLQGIEAMAAINTSIAPAFLMQQIEWREAIAEALAARDIAALDRLQAEVSAQYRQVDAELAKLLDVQHDATAATEAVRKLRFMDKLLAEIGDAYETCES